MTIIIVALLAIWVLYSGWRFYRHVDWDRPPSASPDTAALRKREAEILHIQDVLEEARAAGKLSQAAVDEFNRFAEAELQAARAQAPKR